jgi:hypothetical protein
VLIVEVDDPVGAGEKSAGRTDRDARRVIAMITPQNREISADVRERPLLDVFHPSPKIAERHFVLGFARDGAGMAADAAAIIDNKAVFHSYQGSQIPSWAEARCRERQSIARKIKSKGELFGRFLRSTMQTKP